MIASEMGKSSVVGLLLEEGATLDLLNEKEWCALTIASNCGHHEIVELLLDKGAAQVDLQDMDGWSALNDGKYLWAL